MRVCAERYESSVVNTLRLADGTLWSIPINLDVSRDDIENKSIKPAARITLRDPRDDEALAILTGNSLIIFLDLCLRRISGGHLPPRPSS